MISDRVVASPQAQHDIWPHNPCALHSLNAIFYIGMDGSPEHCEGRVLLFKGAYLRTHIRQAQPKGVLSTELCQLFKNPLRGFQLTEVMLIQVRQLSQRTPTRNPGQLRGVGGNTVEKQ